MSTVKLQWAGGVRMKTEDEGSGVVESVAVRTADTRPNGPAPRRAKVIKSVLESGAFAEVRKLESGPKARATPSGRFRMTRDD